MLAGAVAPAEAQVPGGADPMLLLQQDPEQIRQMLLSSGLSIEEIRRRLAAAGYPTQALDGFLQSGPLDPYSVTDPNTIGALNALGVTVPTPDGLQLVPVQSGLRPRMFVQGDSLRSLPIFGVDAFTRASSRFQPLLDAPPSDDYRLGPGDQIVLVISGEVERAHELEVTREGFVIVPNVGQVFLANLSLGEARTVLRTRLGRAYSGIARGTTNVSFSVTRLRTIQIYVTGEVYQPAAYQLASVATVMALP